MDKAMHSEFEGPKYKGKPDVIRILDNLKAENAALRSELQKQKELNAELVAYVDDLLEDHKNCPWMIDNGHRAESLIKKSKES